MASVDARPSLRDQLSAAYSRVNWTELERRPIYERKWATITSRDYRRPDGSRVNDFYVVGGNDYVENFTWDPETGEVAVVIEFHRGAGEPLLKMAAGKIEDGKTPKEAAAEELRQEAGFTGELIPSGAYREIGLWHEAVMYVFGARVDMRSIKEQQLDHSEDLVVAIGTLRELYEIVMSPRLEPIDGALALAFLRALEAGLIDRKFLQK